MIRKKAGTRSFCLLWCTPQNAKKWHNATLLTHAKQTRGSKHARSRYSIASMGPGAKLLAGLALLLLVLGILADHHDLALAADDLALLADGLHGRTNLHALLPPVVESERVRRNATPDSSYVGDREQSNNYYTPDVPNRQGEIHDNLFRAPMNFIRTCCAR